MQPIKRLAAVALAALLAMGFVACDRGSSNSTASSGGGGGGSAQTGNVATAAELDLAQQVLVLVNQERANAGEAALTMHVGLSQVAYDHSWDMDFRDFFDHVNPDGHDPFDRMQAAGINYMAAGENIAHGYTTASAVMTGWMNSTGHRNNILSSNFTEIGIGVRQGPNGTYWTQKFRRP